MRWFEERREFGGIALGFTGNDPMEEGTILECIVLILVIVIVIQFLMRPLSGIGCIQFKRFIILNISLATFASIFLHILPL